MNQHQQRGHDWMPEVADARSGWLQVCDRCGEWRQVCPGCREPIEGASWRGRCLDCHEASLLPVPAEGLDETGESWSDIYVGREW